MEFKASIRAGIAEQTGWWLGPHRGPNAGVARGGSHSSTQEPRHVTTHKFRKPTRLKFTCWTSRLRSSTPRQTQDNDLRPPSSDQLPIMSLVSGEKVCNPPDFIPPNAPPLAMLLVRLELQKAHCGRFGHSRNGAPSRTLRPFEQQSDGISHFSGASAGFDDHGAGRTGSAARRRSQHEGEMGTSLAGMGAWCDGPDKAIAFSTINRPALHQLANSRPDISDHRHLPREDEDSHPCTGTCTSRRASADRISRATSTTSCVCSTPTLTASRRSSTP